MIFASVHCVPIFQEVISFIFPINLRQSQKYFVLSDSLIIQHPRHSKCKQRHFLVFLLVQHDDVRVEIFITREIERKREGRRKEGKEREERVFKGISQQEIMPRRNVRSRWRESGALSNNTSYSRALIFRRMQTTSAFDARLFR